MTDKWTEGRSRLFQFRKSAADSQVYLGQTVYALIPVERPGIGTMAVDRYGRLYYDPAFVAKIGIPTGRFAILHETLHVAFDHAGLGERILGRAPTPTQLKAWNFACDMVVNGILRDFCKDAPEGIITCERMCLPPKLSAIEYYHLLMKQEEQQQDSQDSDDDESDNEEDEESDWDEDEESDELPERSHRDTEDDDDEEQDADGDGDGDDDADSDDAADDSSSDEEDEGSDSGRGKASSDGEGEADDEGDGDGGDVESDGDSGEEGGEGEGEGDDSGDVTDHAGSGGSCADGQPRDYELPPDEAWEDREYTMAHDLEAKCEEVGWGNVPGELRKVLDQKLRPQPDPFDILRAAVCKAVASPVGAPAKTWKKLKRKQIHGGIRLKGVRSETPNAVVVIDTSGSMCYPETQARCLTVVAQGLKRLRRFKVICGDTRVTSNKHVQSLKQVDWQGGGGTSMKHVLETVDKEDRPDAIILVTDGETDWPTKLRARLVIALTHPNETPTWAKTTMVGPKGA